MWGWDDNKIVLSQQWDFLWWWDVIFKLSRAPGADILVIRNESCDVHYFLYVHCPWCCRINFWVLIVNWTPGNKLQRNLNISVIENAFDHVVSEIAAILSLPQCVNTDAIFQVFDNKLCSVITSLPPSLVEYAKTPTWWPYRSVIYTQCYILWLEHNYFW